MKNTVVAVVSSEKTYEKLNNILFNDCFLLNRDKFDLAVVFNTNSTINHSFKTNFDYTFYRENTGLDPAGFNYLIRNLPDYDYYFLLHDDHFFLDKNWFDLSIHLLENNPNVDVIGNILFNSLPEILQKQFDNFISNIGLSKLLNISTNPYFLHGIAGIYRGKVIQKFRFSFNGIPYMQNNDKLYATFCERLTTLILIEENFNLSQYPGEIFTYLFHSKVDILNSKFCEAMKAGHLHDFDKSIGYFLEYIEIANKSNNDFFIHVPYAHLSFLYKIKENYILAKYYYNKLINCKIDNKIKEEFINNFKLDFK
jgi:hypothetical protein